MASFNVYIDESGDEGFCFDKGSPDWFVLSAVVTRKDNDLQTVRLVDDVKLTLNKKRTYVLHFQKLNHGQRLVLVDRISKARLRAVSVMVHKPSLLEAETFRGKNVLYNYASRFLLERVSWLCRDERLKNDPDGSAHITFSNRAGMSYDNLCTYLEKLRASSGSGFGPERVNIDWSVIKPNQIEAIQHDKRMGLQIVDAVASSFYCGAQRGKLGFSEGRYASMLSRVMYAYKGKRYGYGVKVFPGDFDARPENAEHMKWLHDVYRTPTQKK